MNERPYVAYHANCMDGLGAAAVCCLYLDRPECVPFRYGDPPPVEAVRGRPLYVVDFSWPHDAMVALAESASRLVWVDHHETSAATADALTETWRTDPRRAVAHESHHCGAILTWRHFAGVEPPAVLRYIEDRDLWRWSMHASKEVSAGLALYLGGTPLGFAAALQDPATVERCERVGSALLHAQEHRVAQAVARCRGCTVGGLPAAATNAACDQSEVGHALASLAGVSVGVVWWRDDAFRVWRVSLRSVGEVDVSVIAQAHGGGGHRNAAGCEVADLAEVLGE